MKGFINTDIIQYLGIIGSVIFITIILLLIHSRKIKEEYSLLWLFSGIVFLVISIWRKGLDYLAYFLGIAYPPAALFLVFIIAIISILIHYSIVVSKMSENIKNLVQSVGLLNMELEKMKKELADNTLKKKNKK